MRIIGIIPSRYASTRFPGKPLVDIGGKSMIQRVYEESKKCNDLDEVIIATDDPRIFAHAKQLNAGVEMTAKTHANGTMRCAEVALKYKADYYINIQGDEPFIKPEQIATLCRILDGKTELGTLVKQINDISLLNNPNIAKVLLNKNAEALYFSRTCIPYVRDHPFDQWPAHHTFYKHIGIYAYRSDILQQIANLSEGQLEKVESLEQLRWIEAGYTIKTAQTEMENIGIDTPDDVEKALKLAGIL